MVYSGRRVHCTCLGQLQTETKRITDVNVAGMSVCSVQAILEKKVVSLNCVFSLPLYTFKFQNRPFWCPSVQWKVNTQDNNAPLILFRCVSGVLQLCAQLLICLTSIVLRNMSISTSLLWCVYHSECVLSYSCTLFYGRLRRLKINRSTTK